MYEIFQSNPEHTKVMTILTALDDMGEARDMEAYIAAAKRGCAAAGFDIRPQNEEEASSAYDVLLKVVEDYNAAHPVHTA